MKKIILAVALLATSLLANDIMKESMHKMEMGLSKIQKGYLYNSKSLIVEGLDELYEGNKLFKKADMKSYLPKGKKNMLQRALGYSKNIDKNQAHMKNDVVHSNLYSALGYQADIVKDCAACHKIVRNW